MDFLDYEDKHYQRRKTDLENHLYKTYDKIDEAEKREFLSQLVDNVQIYEERKENGQWLKSIEFKLPIIEKEFTLSLDNDTQNETVVLLSQLKQKPDDYINVTIELDDMDITSAETKASHR